jgi:segregation and condensation protein B
MEQQEIQHFVEAALLAAGRPLSVDHIQALFDGRATPEKSEIREAIDTLNGEYRDRGIEILEVASGFRLQIKRAMADRLQKLWEERPPRYSRALFETLALVAYRQPITRGEIEEIRGVAVSSNIVRTLLEREWIRVVGHRDVPGRPAMFGTTKGFLDYFGLKKLDDLPQLADLSDWESLRVQLNLPAVNEGDEDLDLPENERPVPVLVPDFTGGDLADVDVEMAFETSAENGLDNIPELTPLEADSADEVAAEVEEELVVSEWPDPAESGRG